MPIELTEVSELIDKEKNPEEAQDLMETGIQALLYHQIIYEDMHTVPKAAFDFVKNNRLFFEKYFSAAGFSLHVDLRYQMIAISPKLREKAQYGARNMRLQKDETVLRLVLRYLFEEGLRSGLMTEDGRVESDTAAITDLYRKLAGTEPPSETKLVDGMLKEIARRGGVKLKERDKAEKITRMTILPGIKILVSDSFLDAVQDYLGADLPPKSSIFDASPKAVTAQEEVNV